jgi:serine/threonine-protein kinase
MDTPDPQQVERLFHAARVLPAEERAAYLDAQDLAERVRDEVEGLLRCDEIEHGGLTGEIDDRLVATRELADGVLPGRDRRDAIRGLSSGGVIDHGRFLPGTMLAERYRIVGMLGQGGMGEVYRADDLELGQSVALKFLPNKLVDDRRSLERFRGEVRLARQVSHPNVCRVYDIGQIDGQWFLSMEYVDGEDLAQLLTRIGRFAADRATELARQLCLGLHAAHEKGVLHRDLKPANIMIDGRGKLLITDFGLAEISEQVREDDIRSGTPAYMSPEQLAGREVTERSDIYSLGIILHEVYTGKPVWEAGSMAELFQKRKSSPAPTPSSHISDLDPVVDRVIQRCLEADPDKRPASALAVIAALPGGDPLLAALAAGETPSPEVVAASGDQLGLSLRAAGIVLGCIVALLAVCCRFAESTYLVNQVPMEKQPAVLLQTAKEIIRQDLGYQDLPDDEAYDYYDMHAGYRTNTENREILFWYRQRRNSSFDHAAYWNEHQAMAYGRVTFQTPAWEVPGELGMLMNSAGRMKLFRAIPPIETQSAEQVLAADRLPWQQWFTPAATGFVLESVGTSPLSEEGAAEASGSARDETAELALTSLFAVDDVARTPPGVVDVVRVWRGRDRVSGDEIIVEAAAYRGRPVYFEVFSAEGFAAPRESSNTGYGLMIPHFSKLETAALWGYYINFMILAAIALSWFHCRLGRGDRRAAIRLATYVFCASAITGFATSGRWSASDLLFPILAQHLAYAATVWVTYLSLEPLVRRVWPTMLVSWTRLIDGRWQDPVVGRDLLVGIAGGVLISAYLILAIAGCQATDPDFTYTVRANPNALLSAGGLIGVILNATLLGVLWTSLNLLTLTILRAVLKRESLAIACCLAFGIWATAVADLFEADSYFQWSYWVLSPAVMLWLLIRFGYLAIVAARTTMILIVSAPLTSDSGNWYYSQAMLLMAVVVGMGALSLYTAVGGRAYFRSLAT